MHWVVQENVGNEEKWDEMIHVLKKRDISYSVHKLVPFSGELIPDLAFGYRNVWAYGSLSLAKTAKARGWEPGVIDFGYFDYKVWLGNRIGSYMINKGDIYTFDQVHKELYLFKKREFFVRPVNDSKFIKGQIMKAEDIVLWAQKICELGDDSGADVKATDQILLAEPKNILQEARFWVVNNQLVTWSSYKIGSIYKRDRNWVHQEMIDFANQMIALNRTTPYNPKTYCMDIGLLDEPMCVGVRPDDFQPIMTKYGIIEFNNINSSGLYDADVDKLVWAIQIRYDRI